MTQIEKIKAEIERRINYLNKYKDFTETAASARQELIYLQSFIESMEKEQDSQYDRVMAYVESRYKTLANGKGNTPEGNGYLIGMGDILRFAEKLEKLPTNNSPKIRGWVARDFGPTNATDLNIGKLKIWHQMPYRNNIGLFWMPNFPQEQAIMELPRELYPYLKWEDEPIEVELIIESL